MTTRARMLPLLLLAICAPSAPAAVWANIKTIDHTVLTNGIQVMVKADGILDYYRPGWNGDDYSNQHRKDSEVRLVFPSAKNETGKTVIRVGRPPVSYIELSIPQDAKEGIGVEMRVAFFYPTTASVRATDDRLGVLVTVDSDVTLDTGAQTQQTAITSAHMLDVKADPGTGLLDIVAVKANIHEVLARIGRLTKTNILVDDLIDPGTPGAVGGAQVTIVLAKTSLPDALDAIAAAAGLGVSKPKDPGGIYVFSLGMPSELSAYQLADTRSFPIENVEAATAQSLLPNFLYPHLHVNRDQNAIVVSAPALMLNKIGQDLAVVDKASPQIMVEALAVEFISKDDLERSLSVGQNAFRYLAGTDSATGSIQFQTMVRLPNDFQVKLHALETEGTVKVWAKPRMAVMNGRMASIFIGQTRHVEVEIPTFGGTTKQIQGVAVGVSLSVQPWTGAGSDPKSLAAGEGEITVVLRPEVSSISEISPTTGLPIISRSSADTTVRVKDGETIVIGGLVRHEEFDTHRKIPILGDIPLFGQFFRSKSRSNLDSELVILVTPRLLDPQTGRLLRGDESRAMRLLEEGEQKPPSSPGADAAPAPPTSGPRNGAGSASRAGSPERPVTTRDGSR